MVSLGNRRDGNPILLKSDGSITRPKRISFTEKTFEEGWLQELIRTKPELLPVAEIEPDFAPLVSMGREVATAAGSIDNLFLSPQGYLTIVETKLWRNPEARREVVGQIIDYAKDVSRWSFDELERRVRSYNKQFLGSALGILDSLRQAEHIIDEADESAIVDTISRNLECGRFLLLVVGDGIRESVEAIADFLQQTPQLYFTLALVELQIYEIGKGENKSLLIIPQIVARTKEITRAVVRIEGKAIESVHVTIGTTEIGTGPEMEGEERYFSILRRHVNTDNVDFARRITLDMENLNCKIDWRQGSYVVKLPDPGGSRQDLTLFVVGTDGKIYVGWLDGQLRRIGLDDQIASDFVRDSAQLFEDNGVSTKYPDSWLRRISLEELRQHYSEFVSLVEVAIDKIRQASTAST